MDAGVAAALDQAAEATCDRLAAAFEVDRLHDRPHLAGDVSIGLEIEVPHSAYFPELWARWQLHGRRVADLEPQALAQFGRELAELEQPLRTRLAQTVACGVPRGNDRYWEFSLEPVCDLGLAWEQVELLTASSVLPRDRRHALHATLGDVRRTSDVYYLAMVLEILHVQPGRIGAGVAATRERIFTGWGRKGLSGVFEKGQSELRAGAAVAVELRTLQLPQGRDEWVSMAGLLRAGADAIANRQAGHVDEHTEWFGDVRAAADEALATCGLPANNWWTGGLDGGIQYDTWDRFTKAMPRLRDMLEPVIERRPHGHKRQVQCDRSLREVASA
jgi:hypothetical protein